ALLGTIQGQLQAIREFIVAHDLVGMPTAILPKVEETPPYRRATTQASMDTPGPFETRATEAFYHVTLPDPSWSAARVEDYLGGPFNNAVAEITSIHEALPGHYVQLMWMQRIPGEARRMQNNGAYVEGWAHYCEQMMLDEGYGATNQKADPKRG